jgi:hypothetical protein
MRSLHTAPRAEQRHGAGFVAMCEMEPGNEAYPRTHQQRWRGTTTGPLGRHSCASQKLQSR